MNFPLQPIVGIDFTRTSTIAEFPLGMRAQDEIGTVYRYVRAAVALTRHLAYTLEHVTGTGLSATAAAAAGTVVLKPVAVGVPQMVGGIPSGQFGWVAVEGPFTVVVTASCAANVPLFMGATAGALTDNATSASNRRLGAVMLLTSNSSAGTATAAAVAYVELAPYFAVTANANQA